MVYVSPHTKVTRKNFYYLCIVSFIFGIILMYDQEYDVRLLGRWAVGASILYFFIGIFIIKNTSVRDKVFGKSVCPYCKKHAWTIKEILKITGSTIGNTGKCPECGSKVKYPSVNFYIQLLTMLVVPLFVLLYTGSINLMCASGVLYGIILLSLYGRNVKLKKL